MQHVTHSRHLIDLAIINERTIWALIVTASIACSACLTVMTFWQFIHSPLVSTQIPEGIPVDQVLFPSVSVCTVNRISRKAAVALAKKLVQDNQSDGRSRDDTLELLSTLGRLYDLESADPVRLQALDHILQHFDIRVLLRSLSPSCEDVLVQCVWDRIHYDCARLFATRLTMNGYCCVFNYMKQDDDFVVREGVTSDVFDRGNRSSYGFDSGLRILLNLSTDDDFYRRNFINGAEVAISNPHAFPDAFSGSCAVVIASPNVRTDISLSAIVATASPDVRQIPLRLRGCIFHDESSYLPFSTSGDCLIKCRVVFLSERCGCIPFNLPKMPAVRTCGLRDVTCLKKYSAQSTTLIPRGDYDSEALEMEETGGGIDCGDVCYPICSRTTLLSKAQSEQLYPSDVLNAIPDWGEQLSGENSSDLALFHIYFGDEIATAFALNIVMKWFDIISNVGSTCGFVTGMSFVSVLEFFYFFTFRLFRALKDKTPSTRRIKVKNINVEDKRIYPTSQLYWNEIWQGRNNTTNHMTATSSNGFE